MGHDGTTWACSPGYTVLPEEAKSLATLLASKSLDPITGPGFSVAGQRYAFTRGEVDDDEGGVVCFDLFLVVGLGGGAVVGLHSVGAAAAVVLRALASGGGAC